MERNGSVGVNEGLTEILVPGPDDVRPEDLDILGHNSSGSQESDPTPGSLGPDDGDMLG